jgi:hypothetical protein
VNSGISKKNELKGTGEKVILCSAIQYDNLGRMRKKVVTVCSEVLSKHLMDNNRLSL